MAERFERHKQAWTADDQQAAHAGQEGHGPKSNRKALTRSEESVKDRAKQDGLTIAKLH